MKISSLKTHVEKCTCPCSLKVSWVNVKKIYTQMNGLWIQVLEWENSRIYSSRHNSHIKHKHNLRFPGWLLYKVSCLGLQVCLEKKTRCYQVLLAFCMCGCTVWHLWHALNTLSLQLQSHQHRKPCRSFSFSWINLLTRTDLRGKRIRKIRRQQNICVAWCKCDYPKGGKERKEKHSELYKTYYVFFYLTRWDNKNIFILNKTFEKKP